jgi:hypothetical protein
VANVEVRWHIARRNAGYCCYVAVERCRRHLPGVFRRNVVLGGLVVSVLATGPKVRGFNPGGGRWIFKGDKNP